MDEKHLEEIRNQVQRLRERVVVLEHQLTDPSHGFGAELKLVRAAVEELRVFQFRLVGAVGVIVIFAQPILARLLTHL